MTHRPRPSDWPRARDWYFGIPRPIRRLLWWWIIPFGFVTAQFVFLALWPSSAVRLNNKLGVVGQFIPLSLQISVMLITVFRTLQIKRLFRASGGRLCTNCAHNLAGIADIGKCPECGEPYHIEFDRLTWKRSGMTLRDNEPF